MTHSPLSTFIYLITLTAVWLNDALDIYLFNNTHSRLIEWCTQLSTFIYLITLTAILIEWRTQTFIYLVTLTAVWLNDALNTLDIYLFNNTHIRLIEWCTQLSTFIYLISLTAVWLNDALDTRHLFI